MWQGADSAGLPRPLPPPYTPRRHPPVLRTSSSPEPSHCLHGSDMTTATARSRVCLATHPPPSPPPHTFPADAGTYTGAAHFLKPGTFTVLAWLWYSDCNGLQEPTKRMQDYESGSSALTKKDHCYLGGRVRVQGFPVVDPNVSPAACMQPGCSPKPAPAINPVNGGSLTFRMDTYYYRHNHTYVSCPCCKPRCGGCGLGLAGSGWGCAVSLEATVCAGIKRRPSVQRSASIRNA